MLKILMELDEFQISKVSKEQLHKFFDFLENSEYIKFFVWLNMASEVEYNFDSAPKFGKSCLIKLICLQSPP